jgi:hypothetical protein
MFSVEASRVVPYSPVQVFAVARARDALPQWCGVVRVADEPRAWRVVIRGLALLVHPRTVSIDDERWVAAHEAIGDGLGIRWELTVRPHPDGASLHVRTTLCLDDAHEHRMAVYRTVSRLAAQGLVRLAALVGRQGRPERAESRPHSPVDAGGSVALEE